MYAVRFAIRAFDTKLKCQHWFKSVYPRALCSGRSRLSRTLKMSSSSSTSSTHTTSSVSHLRQRQATVCICSCCWSTRGQEDGRGAVRCCNQGLCVSSAKTKWWKDGSHLARHPPSSSAPCRRRSQLVGRRWHHQTVNRRTWPGCVRRRRADIPRACSTYHQQLLLSTSTSPPNSEARQPSSHEAVGARICHQ